MLIFQNKTPADDEKLVPHSILPILPGPGTHEVENLRFEGSS